MKMNTLPNYPLYETSYGSDNPFQQLYVIKYSNLPSRFISRTMFDFDIISKLNNFGYIEIIRNQNIKTKLNISTHHLSNADHEERYYVNDYRQIIVKATLKNDSDINYINLEILYNISNGELNTQFPFAEFLVHEKKKRKSTINLVKSEMGHLDIEEYQLNSVDIDLELNYGKGFLNIHDLIIKRLNRENDKGIILLHGDPGTGKTSYIKYLTNLIESKEILFIPPSMAETLSEPSIIPFLMEHKNSILIIEDAERVIADRETNGSSPGVSNILNLTDGILGDCLGIQVIATFNMKREKIDQALLRKGRLIAEHKFKNLSVEDTNRLLKSLNKSYVSKEEMSLADIYNIDVELYKSETKRDKIGF